VDIQGAVLLANGYPGQILPLFRAEVSAGSALGRVELFARFCSDAACASPIAVVPLVIDGADANGRYVPASADTTGAGFAKPFTITQAPLGASFVQIIGDTEFSSDAGLGVCSTVANCPADFDVVSIGGFVVGQNVDGTTEQPAPATVALNVTGRNVQLDLPDTFYLGHLHFDRGPLAAPAPADDGTLVMAVSNSADTFRNLIGLVDLSDASATPGALGPASYTLQKNGADFEGDVCGLVRGGGTLYAVGIDNTGANIFRLSATTGVQTSDVPVVVMPPSNMSDPTTYPRPCRGVFGSMGGVDHLYLLQFSGAGSSATSHPYPFYDVDLTNGTYATPITDTDLALRAIAVDGTSHLFAVDMSWSKDSDDNGIGFNRIFELSRDASGYVTGSNATTTDLLSDEQCGSQLNWPSGAAVVSLGGSPRLLVGHDTGVAVYNPSDLTQASNLLLPGFGQLFTELVPSPDGARLYAQPQCKAVNTATTFQLPYAQTTEAADTNLVAILDLSSAPLAVATTSIDIDGNGTPDHGIDLDYWFLKRFIRDHSSTLPIPPVVFTGPQLAVGETMLFVRGSGIQGNGSTAISSSGLGQVQDVGFFSLSTGRGVVFGDYIPWTDGLSSNAGRGPGIWGYDVHAGQESSVGALVYLPAP
jgi:hypothetical protein